MWALPPKVRQFCARTRRYGEKPSCADAHVHTQLGVVLGCGPIANLKSTNTHGTQLRETETEQGEASGYYAWREVLCCCIRTCGRGRLETQRGPQNVSLVGLTRNKVQMALIGNISSRDTFQFVSLSICISPSHSYIVSSSVLPFYSPGPSS